MLQLRMPSSSTASATPFYQCCWGQSLPVAVASSLVKREENRRWLWSHIGAYPDESIQPAYFVLRLAREFKRCKRSLCSNAENRPQMRPSRPHAVLTQKGFYHILLCYVILNYITLYSITNHIVFYCILFMLYCIICYIFWYLTSFCIRFRYIILNCSI